jgi:hypothetical protein
MGLEAERYAENLSLRGYCEIEGRKNSEGFPAVMVYIFEAVLGLINPFVTSGTYMSHLQIVFFKFAGVTVSHFFSMLPSTLKYIYFAEPVRMNCVCCAACSVAHTIICTRLFCGKMHCDWFNRIEILQGR